MSATQFDALLSLIERLREVRIFFTLSSVREGAIMVNIAVPGERWEVEYCADGSVEVERFVSTGAMEDESALPELFKRFSD